MRYNQYVIDNVQRFIENRRVLLRTDLNVPLDQKTGEIKDMSRINLAIPTIKQLLELNIQSLVILSHLGRPNARRTRQDSLLPVKTALEQSIGAPITFIDEDISKKTKQIIRAGKQGQIFMLNNVRFHPEETGSYIDDNHYKVKVEKRLVEQFRQELTALGDLYVNDAFGTSHRNHSSVVGITHSLRIAGCLLNREIEFLGQALQNPKRPFCLILGGAKVADKLPLIDQMLQYVDELIIGGGMAFTFLQQLYPQMNIGSSIFDPEGFLQIDQIMEKAKKRGVKIVLPVDFLCATSLKADQPEDIKVFSIQQGGIPQGYIGLDAGPQSIKANLEVIGRSKLILWNGPQGFFENQFFAQGSTSIVHKMVEQTQDKGAITICGGGDTLRLVNSVKDAPQHISHLSSGGGAALEFLKDGNLPGIAHLTDKNQILGQALLRII